jgi:hypothetical protein
MWYCGLQLKSGGQVKFRPCRSDITTWFEAQRELLSSSSRKVTRALKYKVSHITRNPPTSMRRLFRVVTNSITAAEAACCRGEFHVTRDTLCKFCSESRGRIHGNTASYSGSPGFEFRPGRLRILRFSVVLLSPSRCQASSLPQIRHRSLPSVSFPIHYPINIVYGVPFKTRP